MNNSSEVNILNYFSKIQEQVVGKSSVKAFKDFQEVQTRINLREMKIFFKYYLTEKERRNEEIQCFPKVNH